MASSAWGVLKGMVNAVAGFSEAAKESAALKDFDEEEARALREDFARVASFRPSPTCIDQESLELELDLGQSLCNKVFSRMQQLGRVDSRDGPLKPEKIHQMKLPVMASAVGEICRGNRDEQISFVLSVIADDRGNVPRENCRNFLAAYVRHALPDGMGHDEDLQSRLVQVSMDFAFSRAKTPSCMSPDEAEEWLLEDSEARQFFRCIYMALELLWACFPAHVRLDYFVTTLAWVRGLKEAHAGHSSSSVHARLSLSVCVHACWRVTHCFY